MYQSTPSHISYKKDSTGTVESKFILPVRIPSDLITAIDIGHLTEAEVDEITILQREYTKYVESFMKTMFKFEDWVELTKGTRPEVKWRSYKVDNILKSD